MAPGRVDYRNNAAVRRLSTCFLLALPALTKRNIVVLEFYPLFIILYLVQQEYEKYIEVKTTAQASRNDQATMRSHSLSFWFVKC